MERNDFLYHIAVTAYNVGFGAKRHFATYDIVNKTPGAINFFVISFGVYALIFDDLSIKFCSATLIVMGIIGLYISFYDTEKHLYEKAGKESTILFNDLRKIYLHAKTADDSCLKELEKELKEIDNKFQEISISKQILFSNWYTHYKFFWETQIDWIAEQRHFSFFRDKIPLSFWFAVIFAIILSLVSFSFTKA